MPRVVPLDREPDPVNVSSSDVTIEGNSDSRIEEKNTEGIEIVEEADDIEALGKNRKENQLIRNEKKGEIGPQAEISEENAEKQVVQSRRNSTARSGRRSSIQESLRRMSFDVAVHVGMIDEEVAEKEKEDGDDDDDDDEKKVDNKPEAVQRSVTMVHNPVSFWWHTITTNVQGVMSALPSCIFLILMKRLNEWINELGKGGFFGDMHVVRCTGCLLMIDALTLVLRWDRSLTKRNLMIAIPCRMAFMVGFSAICGWKIGAATPAVTTLAFAFGEWFCWPYEKYIDGRKKTNSFPKAALRSFILALASHGAITFLINALVLPTKLLAESGNSTITMFATGVAFPILIFLVRKGCVSFLQKWIADMDDKSEEEKIEFFNMAVTCWSLMIIMTPTVLLYFNVDPTYALFSGALQVITEVGGKFYTVWSMKAQFKAYLDALRVDGKVAITGKAKRFAMKAMKTPGFNHDVEVALESEANEDGAEDDEENHEYKLRYPLHMLAIRYSAEIVAEKGCIITASVIADLYFQDLIKGDPKTIGAMFYAFEVVADCLLVYILNNTLDVPILSAVPRSKFCSLKNLRIQAVMCLTFAALGNCIAMSSSINV